MKKLLGILLALTMPVSLALADEHRPHVSSSSDEGNHGEVGVFINYFRFNNPVADDTNFYGVGARVGFNIARHVQLEAEGAYDPQQNVTFETLTTPPVAPVRVVHFMFGPKFQAGSTGPVRFFVTAKGGLINFSPDSSFIGQIGDITTSGDTFATFYPGLGFEFFAHWFGVRFEAGDEMYFNGGVNHNARATAGPVFRF